MSHRITYRQELISLKVEYMELFVQAASSVLKKYSEDSIEPGPLGLLGTTFPTASINIAARIKGSLEGDIVYSMSSQTAKKLAGVVTGTETHSFGRVMGSGLVRLGDMLADQTGRILKERGLHCEISSPTVFQGMNVEFSVTAPALAIPINTSAGRIDVNVAVNDA